MKKNTTLLLLIAVVLLSLAPGIAPAAPVGTFTKIEGSVDILRAGAIDAVAVRVGEPVSMGDAIRTKRNSRAEVQFNDESVIQLASESRIKIDQYSFSSGNVREKGFLSLFRGKVRAIVAKLKTAVVPVSRTDSGFNIKTPTAIAGVKGTDFIVYYERGISGTIFLEGQGFVYNPDQPTRIVSIQGGQATFVMGGGQAPTDPIPVSNTFTAPHLKDTTINLTSGGGNDSDGLGGNKNDSVDILTTNTTYESLTDTQNTGGDGTTNFDTFTDPFAPPVDLTTIVPYTETNSKLIVTPVTVNVKIP